MLNWNSLWRIILCNKRTCLPCEMHWKNALVSRFLLLFWSYRPKLLQCFLENTSAVNISSQDHFLITRTGKKAVNLRVVATSLLGNFGHQTNRKKDLQQKQNCSGAACLRWHHPADINWDAVMTDARQVQIQTDRKKDLFPKPNDSAYDPQAFHAGPPPHSACTSTGLAVCKRLRLPLYLGK